MRRVLIVFSIVLLSLAANAQMLKIGGHEFGYFYAGPKVGVAFSQISNSNGTLGNSETKFRSGLQLGVVGKLGITERWSIQPELTFMQKGVRIQSGPFETNYKTSYIGIPILAKYSLMAIGFAKIHINGGAYTSYRTSGKVEFKDPGFTSTQSLSDTSWRRMDYGLTIGAGAELPRKLGTWVFDVRYDYGFVDASKDDPGVNSNRTISVSVTYLYDFVDLYKRMKNKKKPEGVSAVNK